MMWAIMGIGMLIQTLQNAGQNSQMRSNLQAQNQAMQKSLNNAGMLRKRDPVMTQRYSWDFEPPPYPDKAYKNVQNMQQQQLGERQQFQQDLKQQLAQMKDEVFSKNHYETEHGQEGKPRVATNADGKPQLKPGPEGPDHRLARQDFEASQKSQLSSRHADQRDGFMKKESSQFKQFLASNNGALDNPVVQGELSRMVVDTKKKALKLQQDQEDERWKVDLPPSQEIHAVADAGLRQMREMEARHVQEEESSPDVQELLGHDQKIAAILAEQREIAAEEKTNKAENFLMDPRKIMGSTLEPPRPKDPGEVLPAYLAHAMYDMGIYEV